ncbi:MAG: AraC family transcriptional regulator [Bacteroidales bacterium]|nr:AraC family transcriptional regulator [Bacteroidales bacterium]MDD6493378.1 AraC family transcriptional regulator [Bacteroidales bacterium]MDY4926828.1 AraC family transcriptional regulator [Prevotella sp.]MDY5033337.1 AraC family transcriptional regulator [Prevotella sp.]
MNEVISEITRLTDKDCYHLVERHKKQHTYPLHRHGEMELNFVENCSGNRRIIGDSIEVIDCYDLVLMGGGLEHTWEQYECQSNDIREVTIHFSRDLFSDAFLSKTHLKPLADLISKADVGVAFGMKAIMHNYDRLNELVNMEPGFYSVMKFIELMYELSLTSDYRLLSTSAFAHTTMTTDSRRVQKVKDYIDANFKDDIRLQELADLANMTPTAFSRFFKLRTGKSISEYIIDVRLGHAARMLADSTMAVVEICYRCGFNNISNFNRIFKRKKGLTPTEFRENYHKKHIIV